MKTPTEFAEDWWSTARLLTTLIKMVEARDAEHVAAQRDTARTALTAVEAQLGGATKALTRIRDDYGDVWGGSKNGVLACMYCGETGNEDTVEWAVKQIRVTPEECEPATQHRSGGGGK